MLYLVEIPLVRFFPVCFFFKEIPCLDCSGQIIQGGIIGGVIGVVLTLTVVAVVCILIKKGKIREYNQIMADVIHLLLLNI